MHACMHVHSTSCVSAAHNNVHTFMHVYFLLCMHMHTHTADAPRAGFAPNCPPPRGAGRRAPCPHPAPSMVSTPATILRSKVEAATELSSRKSQRNSKLVGSVHRARGGGGEKQRNTSKRGSGQCSSNGTTQRMLKRYSYRRFINSRRFFEMLGVSAAVFSSTMVRTFHFAPSRSLALRRLLGLLQGQQQALQQLAAHTGWTPLQQPSLFM